MTSASNPDWSTSFLIESVVDAFKNYKDEKYPIAGDLYYDQIITGVLQNQIIFVSYEHFTAELRIQLEQLTSIESHKIITKAIKKTFEHIEGVETRKLAEKENRFNWKLIK